ncbi:histidine kinase [Catellatospora sp. IY07-71]|uniref:sensor histidine kinase n=1 Tax=Catellatospora sp. IY07-71 TaxID=2728827 RepID=UPI001BB6C0D7|nr:CHASE3 domain-containing protein [Catellatospora sp. IY07-71]BCJ74612.1 histidine kinase [Catellatospora sp. IY07-71]
MNTVRWSHPRGWSLRARITALVSTAAVLLALLALAATALAAVNREQLDVVLNKTGVLRLSGEQLGMSLLDQETGMRGYALSGDVADLGPYRDGREQEEQLYATMIPLLEDYPQIRGQLERARLSATAWRTQVAEPAITKTRDAGPEAAQELLNQGEGKQRFDSARTELAKLQDQIVTVRNQAVDDVRSSSNQLVVLLIAAGLVIVVLGAGLVVMINRMVTVPVTQLAAQVRNVARGAYDADISVSGAPELASLGRDVDIMRRQIADDLREVRRARAAVEAINQQLQAQASELTRSNRDLEQFAYVASHDLQEPLRKVASFCQLLQRRYAGQLDERADQYILFAVDGAQRMQRLINDLLAFSRIGRNTSGFEPVSLDAVMAEVAAQVNPEDRFGADAVTWSELPTVSGEEALLVTLLANLVGNSLKFRRPDVPPRIAVSARRDGDSWEITVADNGIGIEAEFAEKIFIIFQRLHPKDAYPGTGMGLAIAKKIVEYHGGRIWVDATRTEGAAILFALPVTDNTGAATLPVPTQHKELTA